MNERLAEKEADALMDRMGKGPTILIPEPVNKDVELSLEDDQEFCLENLSGI
jgi:hypothetical protein